MPSPIAHGGMISQTNGNTKSQILHVTLVVSINFGYTDLQDLMNPHGYFHTGYHHKYY